MKSYNFEKKLKEFVSKRLFNEKIILNKDINYPKISIVTPSYNQAQFLERTILSVLNQNYPNFEYIIIDGGSTDGSVEIIEKYEKYLTCWVSEKDKGQADAINKGFKKSSGNTFGWLNSDDIYLPNVFFKVINVFNIYSNAGMIYSNGLKINDKDKIVGWPKYEQYSLFDMLCFRIIHQPTVFIRSKLYGLVGGIDISYNLLLDHELWLRLVQKTSVKYIDEYWAAARDHITAKNRTQTVNFGKEASRIIESFFKQNNKRVTQFKFYQKRIKASVICFDAQYLLSGGYNLLALKNFKKAIFLSPKIIPRYFSSIVLSILTVLGMGKLQFLFKSIRWHFKTFPKDLSSLRNYDLLKFIKKGE